MKNFVRKLGMLILFAVVLRLFSTVEPASAASAWSFATSSGNRITVDGTLKLTKEEYQNINLYKNGKEIRENDATYQVRWSSSNSQVVWVDAKSGKLRADKNREMTDDSGTAAITATITNVKTGAKAVKGFTILVVTKRTPELDMAVYPEWFILPNVTNANRATPTPTQAPYVGEADFMFVVNFNDRTIAMGDEGARYYAVDTAEDGIETILQGSYTVEDATVLKVSYDGYITPLQPGKTNVKLTVAGKSLNISITVVASMYDAVKGATGLRLSEDEAAAVKQVKEIIAGITSPNMSTYEKIKAVHDYIIQHTEYKDRGISRDHNALGVILDGYAVCEGYAKAFDLFMYALDIPCIMVSGIAGEPKGPHAWNIVWLDGVPYHIDLTYDDPISTDETDANYTAYNYFLLPEAYIQKTHEFVVTDYPYCKDTYYTYYLFRNHMIQSIRDFESKFIELYALNQNEVLILYPENQKPDKEIIFRNNGRRGYSTVISSDGSLPKLGEYSMVQMTMY